MISFADLSYSYAGKPVAALHQVNLEIPQGSIFALLGPNGAGKTTLLRILCGRLSGYLGSLQLPDQWTSAQGSLDPRKYGVLIENPGIYGRLCVAEYLEFFASFYAMSDSKSRIKQLAERFALDDLSVRMNSLSLGMRQKVQIMRAFLHHAPLILLDEPSSNLDPMARDEVWRLVRETNQQEGTTFIICSHLLAEMERNATRLGLIQKGLLVTSGSLEEIRKRYAGRAEVTVRFAVEVGDLSAVVAQVQTQLPADANCSINATSLRYECAEPKALNPKVILALVGLGIPLEEVLVKTADLGEIYRKLVK